MGVIKMGMYGTDVIVNKREFEDICMSALRYALYRHTYVLDSTLMFIETYANEVMSNRVWNVIYRDVNERLNNWYDNDDNLWKLDFERIKIFKDWLVEYGKEYGYCDKEYEYE